MVLEVSLSYGASGVPSAALTVATVDRYPVTGAAGVVQSMAGNQQAQSGTIQKVPRAVTAETADNVPVTAYARCTTVAAQSIPNNTNTVVDFDTVVDDPDGLVTTGAGWVFTAPVAGRYHVTASVMFAASVNWALGTKNAQLFLAVNGVALSYLDYNDSRVAGTSQFQVVHGSDSALLAMGDTISILVRQSTGGALALLNSAFGNYVKIFRNG
jgi:hypothetical protein